MTAQSGDGTASESNGGEPPEGAAHRSVDASVGERRTSAVLTPREVEVIDLAAIGLSNRQIAEQLCLSEDTILGDMKSIFVKLGAHSKVQAVVLAIAEGIIEVPDIRVEIRE